MQNQDQKDEPLGRRIFLRSGIVFTGAVLMGPGSLCGAEEKKSEEVGPPEDLMREHGVLKHALLIYGFPHFARSFPRMNSMLWAKISRRKKTSFSAKTGLRRWWIRLQESKSDSAFMISPSLRRRRTARRSRAGAARTTAYRSRRRVVESLRQRKNGKVMTVTKVFAR